MRRGGWILVAAGLCGLAAPAWAAETPRRKLRQILRRPIYQRWRLRQERAQVHEEEEGGMWRSLADRWSEVMGRVADTLADLFPKRRRPGPAAADGAGAGGGGTTLGDVMKVFGWTMLCLLGAWLLWLLVKYLRGVRRAGAGAHVLGRVRAREALESGEALALDGAEWLAEAERFATEHDFRAMYRALYLGLLSGLHAANKIDFRRNRTNWTYVARFRGPDDERDTFASLTSVFDRVWYGAKEPGDVSLDEVKMQVSRLLGRGGVA
ncbi:MAG: DUF4129 domain-containing protein [Planctomycetota bacterium]